MQSIYTWLVFVHVLAAFAFVLAHGASALVAFRVRTEREPQRIAALLDLSFASTFAMYASLLLLFAAGVAAGVVGHWFARVWIWTAIGVLIAVTVAMLAYAVPYYERVSIAVGRPSPRSRPEQPPPPAPPEELAALLDSRRPEVITAIGGIGLALLVWLMLFKPF
jgi:hypothetical protein